MFDYLPDAGILHLITTFISVRLLLYSFAVSVFGGWHNFFNEVSWKLMIAGGMTAFLAMITGLIGRVPDDAPVSLAHQFLGAIGTIALLVLLHWRYNSRLRGADVGKRLAYRCLAAVGLIWLVLVGATGSHLACLRAVGTLLE